MQYLPIAWMLISLGILIYTFWDAPKWYATRLRTWTIAALTYGPAHYATMQWSAPAEALLFIAVTTAWAFALHQWVRFALWDLPPSQPTQDPQIAAAYQELGISTPQPQTATYTAPVIEVDESPFAEQDEWEVYTPTSTPTSTPVYTNGVH